MTNILDWTIRELAMYDLPALVEHVCQETGYDKVRLLIVLHHSLLSSDLFRLAMDTLTSCVTDPLTKGRIHRSLARKRPSIHLPLSGNVSIPRKETISLHSPSSSSLCWSIDYRIPIHSVESDRMEYLETILWGTGFHTAHAVGI